MSLINEALKRAETDKLRNSPYFNNLTVLPPVDADDDEFPPPPRPVFREPRRRGLPVVSAIAGAMIFAGLIGGGVVYLRLRGQAAPQTVVAATPSAAAAVPRGAAVPKGNPSAPTPPEVSPPAELAFARTLASVQYYEPPVRPGPPVEPAAAAAPASPLAPAARPVPPVAARPVPPAPAVRPPRPASSPAAAKRRFRLTAVMSGPAGYAALINGELLREGQTTIEGAEVLHIGPHHAELELDGQRFTVRLSS